MSVQPANPQHSELKQDMQVEVDWPGSRLDDSRISNIQVIGVGFVPKTTRLFITVLQPASKDWDKEVQATKVKEALAEKNEEDIAAAQSDFCPKTIPRNISVTYTSEPKPKVNEEIAFEGKVGKDTFSFVLDNVESITEMLDSQPHILLRQTLDNLLLSKQRKSKK